MKTIWLQTTDSTNSEAHRVLADIDKLSVIAAYSQTAGRGQRGNRWTSAPGENLTFSIILKPVEHNMGAVNASDQFIITEIITLALAGYLKSKGIESKIKWPNDIYVADSKICGILIENVITGRNISRSIAGIGLNINQRRFLSDAPNPVSLAQLTGRTFPVDEIARSLTGRIADIYSEFIPTNRRKALHERYKAFLWRRQGFYPYLDTTTGERISGAISAIAPTGHLTLTLPDGTRRTYAFKEVAALLE